MKFLNNLFVLRIKFDQFLSGSKVIILNMPPRSHSDPCQAEVPLHPSLYPLGEPGLGWDHCLVGGGMVYIRV